LPIRQEEARRLLGARVAGYELVELLGTGATAAVFRARSDRRGDVALKVSRPNLLARRRSTARFMREVQAIKRIDHQGCVDIVDSGIEDGRIFIAMELVDGDDLATIMDDRGTLSPKRAVSIAQRVLEVLAAAHQIGVVHRDLKPSNIRLLPTGQDGRDKVKVLDFGLAKLFRNLDDADETIANTLTTPGATLGTPRYMAPEQFRVDEIDHRVDIYSVGVILYEMLSGRLPIDGSNAIEVLVNLSSSEPTPITDHMTDLDPGLAAAVMRCLSRDPTARFRDVQALHDELDDVLEGLDAAQATKVMVPASVQKTIASLLDGVETLPRAYPEEQVTEQGTKVMLRPPHHEPESDDTLEERTEVFRAFDDETHQVLRKSSVEDPTDDAAEDGARVSTTHEPPHERLLRPRTGEPAHLRQRQILVVVLALLLVLIALRLVAS
jgi:serine/threonine protein kinase